MARGLPAVMHQAVQDRLAARVRTALQPLVHLAVTPETLETRAAMGLDLGYRRTP